MTTSMRALGNNGRNSRQAVNMFELNYTQRSSSVPRGVRHLESHIEVSNMTGEEKKTQQQTRTGKSRSLFFLKRFYNCHGLVPSAFSDFF